MNLSQITSETRRLVRDTSGESSLQRWTDAILLERINQVQEEMAAFTGMLESQVDIAIVSGTSEYAFTSVVMAIKKAYYLDDNSVYIPLRKATITELDMIDPAWRDVTGAPSRYYIRDNYIGLYPEPDVSRTAGLRLEIVNRPTDLVNSGDIPFNSEYQFYFAHEGICFGTARLCMMDENKMDAVNMFESKYFNVIKEIQKQMSSENIDVRIPNVYETQRSGSLRTR